MENDATINRTGLDISKEVITQNTNKGLNILIYVITYRYQLNTNETNDNVSIFLTIATAMIRRQITLTNGTQKFNSIFGITPYVCAVTWYLLNPLVSTDTSIQHKHLLWCLFYLKNYSKEEVMRPIFSNADNKTIRYCIWQLIDGISKLGDQVILFDRRFEGNTPYRARMTIDRTDFQIRQPSLKSAAFLSLSNEDKSKYFRSWYSFKYKGPALRYEVGVCISTGTICWINGPFQPGIYNDLKIFQETLMKKLILGEQVEADKGYRGEPLYATVPVDGEDPQKARMKTLARMRQENVNHFFKAWQILKQVFRNDPAKHCMVFWSVAVLTQISFDTGAKINYHFEYIGETYEEARQYLGNQI